jgi:hypothetical protein
LFFQFCFEGFQINPSLSNSALFLTLSDQETGCDLLATSGHRTLPLLLVKNGEPLIPEIKELIEQIIVDQHLNDLQAVPQPITTLKVFPLTFK